MQRPDSAKTGCEKGSRCDSMAKSGDEIIAPDSRRVWGSDLGALASGTRTFSVLDSVTAKPSLSFSLQWAPAA